MSALAAIALFAAQQPAAHANPLLAKLPPRAPIAALAGFQSTSTIVFAESGAAPHVFETTYVFPGRARWLLGIRGEDASVRHVEYRCGEAFFELAQGAHESQRITRAPETNAGDAPLGPDPIDQKCFAFELRRALFVWPDGFEWRGEGDLRAAPLDCTAYGEPLYLEARLGADGRPVHMRVAAQEVALQAFDQISWRESRGHWWPASMRLLNFQRPVWTETVDSVDTAVHMLDDFFVPPDRREMRDGWVRFDLQAAVEKRIALREPCAWADARKLAAELAEKELPPLAAAGWKPVAGAWYELDDAGRPRACLLRLRADGKTPPDGWSAVADATALLKLVPALDGDHATTLAGLPTALPPGAEIARRCIREFSAADGSEVQLVIPLRPRR